MSEKYYGFEKFCELLDDTSILKKHSVMGVVKMLQICITEVKSEVLLKLSNEKDNDHYLDYLINEIVKQDYLKDIKEKKIAFILKEFNVTIEQLTSFNYPYELNEVIDVKLSWENYIENYVYVSARQSALLDYFLNFYANELIAFLESKKSTFIPSDISIKKSNSQIIVNNICAELYSLRVLNETMADEIQATFGNDPFADHSEIEMKYDDDIEDFKIKIKDLFQDLYKSSIKDNYYFFDCPLAVYKSNFEIRKEEYFSNNIDANEEDFLISEMGYFNFFYNNRILTNSKGDTFKYSETYVLGNQYRLSLKRKLEFLSMCLKDFHKELSIEENAQVTDRLTDFHHIGTQATLKEIPLNMNNSSSSKQIKWIGKPSQLGFIMANLAQLGYIEAPERKNGEINYTQFARLVKETFETETTESTLSKYLNLDSEKGKETVRNFGNNNFNIPHIKEIS